MQKPETKPLGSATAVLDDDGTARIEAVACQDVPGLQPPAKHASSDEVWRDEHKPSKLPVRLAYHTDSQAEDGTITIDVDVYATKKHARMNR